MRKIKEVLRPRFEHPARQIAKSCGIASSYTFAKASLTQDLPS
jgi:hypothetical protein